MLWNWPPAATSRVASLSSSLALLVQARAGLLQPWAIRPVKLGFKVRYFHVFKLFEEITNNRIEGTHSKFFKKLADTDLLIIDDFGVRSLDKQQMLDFMELMEDRHGMKSTIIVSQLPVANWYDMMKVNSTAADAILDRIVHTADIAVSVPIAALAWYRLQ